MAIRRPLASVLTKCHSQNQKLPILKLKASASEAPHCWTRGAEHSWVDRPHGLGGSRFTGLLVSRSDSSCID